MQGYNAGLNFANVNEARNFIKEIEKKLQAKEQRRQGKENQMETAVFIYVLWSYWTVLWGPYWGDIGQVFFFFFVAAHSINLEKKNQTNIPEQKLNKN